MALSNYTLSKRCGENGVGCVPFGFRSSSCNWAAKCWRPPREVCELALAHVDRDRFEDTHLRSDLFESGWLLMAEWADYIEEDSGNGLALARRRRLAARPTTSTKPRHRIRGRLFLLPAAQAGPVSVGQLIMSC